MMRLATLLHLQLLLSATQGVFSLAANSSALVPATQPKTRENGGNAIRGDRPSDMYRSGNGSSSSFIITSSSATAQVGAIVFLPCRAPPDLAQQAQVSWVRRQDWHILTSGLQTYTKEQRFAVHHTNGSNEWTLAIKYVQLSDQGMYECQIVSGATAMSQLVQLAVMTPHAVIPGDGEHHVDAGSTIAIECFIQQSAAAPQYIFWYHNSRMINYDKQRGGISVTIDTEPEVRSRLTITNARPSDSGNYTCVAANTRPASINVYITQVNKIAAIQSRAVGSSSRIAVIAYNLLWLPLAVVLTPTPSLAPDSSIRWLVTLVISHVFGAAARLVLACHITWRLPLILQLGEQNTNALGSVNMKYLNQKTDSARNNNLETVSI